MQYKWIVCNHHIALDGGTEILHPSADEIYEFVAGENPDISAENPVTAMNSLHFSRIGAPVKCEVNSKDDGTLILDLYTVRKHQKVPVDMIEGTIVDHCVFDGEWFYVNGDLEALEKLFENAGISGTGRINTGQYIQLMKQEYFAEHKEIINHVDPEVFSRLMIPEGRPPAGLKADLYDVKKF